jgi:hypothetical protein
MTPAQAGPAAITVRRAAVSNGPGRYDSWVYSYTTPADIDWADSSGTTRPGPRAGQYVEYGKGLAGLRDVLRRKYGRDVRITEEWKQQAAQ